MIRFIFIVFVLIFASCTSDDPIPDCLDEKIRLEEQGGCGDGMDEYIFNDRKVYIFTQSEPICSDFGSPVYDEFCNELCFIGGIAGFVLC